MTHEQVVAALRYGDRLEQSRDNHHDVYPVRKAPAPRIRTDLPYAGGRTSDDFAGCVE